MVTLGSLGTSPPQPKPGVGVRVRCRGREATKNVHLFLVCDNYCTQYRVLLFPSLLLLPDLREAFKRFLAGEDPQYRSHEVPRGTQE